jgi:hypothetical protein
MWLAINNDTAGVTSDARLTVFKTAAIRCIAHIVRVVMRMCACLHPQEAASLRHLCHSSTSSCSRRPPLQVLSALSSLPIDIYRVPEIHPYLVVQSRSKTFGLPIAQSVPFLSAYSATATPSRSVLLNKTLIDPDRHLSPPVHWNMLGFSPPSRTVMP